mmetsp:Transcript_3363/g.8408  ORF Transcript_3363/g.8408 Transcript_3363/m.8408 type:complete len:211 (+) Transcript_3363:106-738(+)
MRHGHKNLLLVGASARHAPCRVLLPPGGNAARQRLATAAARRHGPPGRGVAASVEVVVPLGPRGGAASATGGRAPWPVAGGGRREVGVRDERGDAVVVAAGCGELRPPAAALLPPLFSLGTLLRAVAGRALVQRVLAIRLALELAQVVPQHAEGLVLDIGHVLVIQQPLVAPWRALAPKPVNLRCHARIRSMQAEGTGRIASRCGQGPRA